MTFGTFLSTIFTGKVLAILGAALAALLSGIGSAKGVGLVGEATSGMIIEDPSKFGRALILQAIPGTQGVYGLVTAFMILNTIGLFGTPLDLTVEQGAYLLASSLPIGIVGLYSAIKQGRVAASGISLISKRPGEAGKAITSAALVETYAIFSLLISLLPIIFFKTNFGL